MISPYTRSVTCVNRRGYSCRCGARTLIVPSTIRSLLPGLLRAPLYTSNSPPTLRTAVLLLPVCGCTLLGITFLSEAITIAISHIWALCTAREHSHRIFLPCLRNPFSYQLVMTFLLLLEGVPLENLPDPINLVSAFLSYTQRVISPHFSGADIRKQLCCRAIHRSRDEE